MLLQTAIYCGVPDANTAFRIAQQVLDEERAHEPRILYAAVRTPFGRFGGALAGGAPRRPGRDRAHGRAGKAPGLDPVASDEVVWGNANGAGEDNRNVGRMAGAARRAAR